MVRLIIAERVERKDDHFTEIEPDELTGIGIEQMIFEAKRLIEELEERHATLNDDDY